jgi:hypothetical protein
MKRETVARIQLEPGHAARARFLVQAKLPTDEPGHPYGQWSLAIERISELADAVLGWVEFVGDDAPTSALERGAGFDLYVGPARIGRAEIVTAPPRAKDVPVDEDLFVSLHRPARAKAA